MTREQQISFKEAALPLVKWLNKNVHPHHTAIVIGNSAELLEGQCFTGQIVSEKETKVREGEGER